MTEPTDLDLVQDARAGDAGALAMLLSRHRPAMYATALSLLRDRAEAQDAVQDAMLAALRRLGDLREPAAAGAWLRAIVVNTCRMRLRSRREIPAETQVVDRVGVEDVEAALDRLALRDWVWSALERLPVDLRATVMLRHFSRHHSYAEIAAVLGLPIGTVRSRLSEAKRRMADLLLATASATHEDHDRLARQRFQEWTEITAELERRGNGAPYAAGCAEDVLVEASSESYRARGIQDHLSGVLESVAAGVRLRLTGVLASHGVTIIEGDYLNPPEDPHHCPPTHTEVRFHPDGATTHLYLYYNPAQ